MGELRLRPRYRGPIAINVSFAGGQEVDVPNREPVESAEAKALRLLHEAVARDESLPSSLKTAFLSDILARPGTQLRDLSAIVDEALRDGSS